jgi:hypothetical protein
MYLYIESIGNGVKNTKTPYHSYTQTLCVCDFFAGRGCVNVIHEGEGLNLTIGHLFCQYFFRISIFWR